MAGAERQRALQRRRPGRLAVAGQRVDQIEADPREMPLRDGESALPLIRRMGAAKEGQLYIVEALQTSDSG